MAMKVLVVIPYLQGTAPSQRFRIEQWATALEHRGVLFHFESFESPNLKDVLYRRGLLTVKARAVTRQILSRVKWLARLDRNRWDVIFLHRELLPIGPPVLEWLLARTGVPIVYDFDDAIFLPNISDANRQLAWLKRPRKTGTICRLSTHVIVGNEYLREYAAQFNARVSVVPTTIDTDAYTMKSDITNHDPPVIGWTGSLTTIKHIETITDALKELRKAFRFRFKVVGADRFTLPGLEVESVPWTAASEIANLKQFDIGIMPLPDDDWSRGKCGLKALQYMALGIPVVASSVGVNSEIITDGRNGFLAVSQSEWVDKLSRLLMDPALRREFADQGRKIVEERYAARVQAPRILEILEEACRGRRQPVDDVIAADATRH